MSSDVQTEVVTPSSAREPRPAEAAQPVGRRRDWRRSYARRLAVTDFLALVWVVFGVQIVWLGVDDADSTRIPAPGEAPLAVSYTIVSIVLTALWVFSLRFGGTRNYRVVGAGSTEYKLVADASVRLFGLVAIIAFIFKIDIARGYILLAFPVGIVVLLFFRWAWRQWLAVERSQGRFASNVLLIGSEQSVVHIATQLSRDTSAGYRVVGAWVKGYPAGAELEGMPVRTSQEYDSIVEALDTFGADTVVVTSSDALSPQELRELSWQLLPGIHHLVLAPSLTDVGGPRIHTRPVAGLPLIHVETPRSEGWKKYGKRSFDVLGSGAMLLALSIPLLLVALAVKLTSRGRVLYRQERVGLNGKPFEMLKFRSMRENADSELQQLLTAQGTDGKPLFKVKNDPRLTSIGKVLRKYSIDEFPQLLNVLKGDMSLVGPRPQREAEVALYDNIAYRRLLIKPGMSGLWQISGRSELSWEDAIRLDLFYVENWSLMGDLNILWRTVKAVVAPGASAI
ncbi:sugar transferase [Labedella endophytica]|uniref:sugar transferase n=1 Tax=Labedella endophytica TaxID=1523160 RepID=UPI001FB79E64|nr:sugar transferase [Labedella endophytica]